MRVDLPLDHPFDYQLAMDRLAGYRAPRNKLRNLCLGGDVVRVRKGLYVAPMFPGRPPAVDPLVLAPLIYGPSYVSLETAHLQARMTQTGHWQPDRELDIAQLRVLLRQRFGQVDFDQARSDVRPFIRDEAELDLWHTAFFQSLAERVEASRPRGGRPQQR